MITACGDERRSGTPRGQERPTDRPVDAWIRREAPKLRIVDEDLGPAAHARLEASRRLYVQAPSHATGGHPASTIASRYLLTSLHACGVCDGSLFRAYA